jgi:hypothetical protein
MRLISCALLLLALACTAGRALAGPAPFCGTSASPPDSWEHVVWMWFENHGYDEIVGSAAAPFINRTLIAGCGLATNAHNETHPSLPNYIAATSGLPPGRLGRWTSDCNATAGCLTRAPGLFGQAASWGAYAESMPTMRSLVPGPYAASHNPAVYYGRWQTVPCTTCRMRGCSGTSTRTPCPRSSSSPRTCATTCTTVRSRPATRGSLTRCRALVAESAAYQRGTMAIFVTVDEENTAAAITARSTRATRGVTSHHRRCAVDAPAGTQSNALFNHYSLLRTTESAGDHGLSGGARNAHSMRAAFNL